MFHSPSDVAVLDREAADPPPRMGAPAAGRAYRGWVIAMLVLVATFNTMDRQILAILLEPIKRDLGLSDAQLGLLTGFAYVLFFAAASLPLARLADRRSRRGLITIALAFWSVMTMLSGYAASFAQLALARVGLGIGEAASGPASQSMLSDLFPPERRVAALSLVGAGVPLGIMCAFLVGGRLEGVVGWRGTLVVLGVSGLGLALVLGLTVREPARTAVGENEPDDPVPSVRATLAYLWAAAPLRVLALAAACNVFAAGVVLGWSPAFLMRVHGFSTAQVGAWLGAAAGLGGLAGTVLGGAVAQRLARRDPRWLLGVPAIAGLVAAPFLLLFLTLPSHLAVLAAFGVLFFGPAMLGPVMAVTQGVARPRMRAFAAALVGLVQLLLGFGLGPLAVGIVSDLLAARLGSESLRWAMGVGVLALLASGALFALGARRLAGVVLR